MEVPKMCRNGHLDTEPCGICQQKRAEAAEAQVEVLREHMQTFVNRVDAGEVRSKKTYAAFKDAIANLPGRAESIRKVLEAADAWQEAWQKFCDADTTNFKHGFEDHRACYDLAEAVRGREEK